MRGWTADRWAASSGVLFAILSVVCGVLPGEPADYNASASDLSSYFSDKHAELTVQTVGNGVLLVLLLWFMSSFAGMFRDVGQRRLSTVMYGATVAGIAVVAIADSITIAAVQLNPVLDDSSMQALYGVGWFMYHRVFWLLAALALATGLATLRSGAFPQWFAWLSFAGVILFLIGGVSVRMYGFFSPNGEGGFIAFLVFSLWILVASVLLVRKLGTDAAAERPVTPSAAPA
jgi:hypothetical protein